MTRRCLLIADDLTGGTDSGAQFADKGFATVLVTGLENTAFDSSLCPDAEVLVVDTDTRELAPDSAARTVARLFRDVDGDSFPLVYKKIDSTLRGNLGPETDALLELTAAPVGFLAPAYPEQHRTVVDGTVLVRGRPVSLTEAAGDAAPVRESDIASLLAARSAAATALIDLACVRSGAARIAEAVERERGRGVRILIFDAVTRADLGAIVEAAGMMDTRPLFIGSAGLAREVARTMSPATPHGTAGPCGPGTLPPRRIFIVSGSRSGVTGRQLERMERSHGADSFRLSESLIPGGGAGETRAHTALAGRIAEALTRGHTVFKAPSIRLQCPGSRITHLLGAVSSSALDASGIEAGDLAVVITGGATAGSVLRHMGVTCLEIEGELLEGIPVCRTRNGTHRGLRVITKAGAFGEDDALARIVEALETGTLDGP